VQQNEAQRFGQVAGRRGSDYRSEFPRRVAAHADAIGDCFRRCADILRPVERARYEEWLPKNLYLSQEVSANPGLYQLEKGFEYWRGPISAAQDEAVEEIVLNLPTQIGKTTFLEAMMTAISMNDPAPGMLAGPDQDDIHKVRDELYKICESSRSLRKHIPTPRNRNMRWIQIGGTRWYLAWSGNTQKLSGKSCRWVLCTECDKWRQSTKEGLTQDLVRERVKAFASYKLIFESTPTDENSFIANRYEESNKCRFQMPCPHCKHWQELRFHVHTTGPYKGRGGVVGFLDDRNLPVEPDRALKDAYYVCEGGGCTINDDDRVNMIDQGRWVPAGQRINKRGQLLGEPERSSRVTGFNATSLIGKHVTFGKIASEYCRSHGDQKKEQNFVNNWLGEKYVSRAKAIRWRDLHRKLIGGHQRGSVPASAFFLTAGIDKQKDRAYWSVRAWGDGKTSWLVDWGVVSQQVDEKGHLRQASDLQRVWDDVIQRDFPVVGGANVMGWPTLRVVKAGCDTQYRPMLVWNWVRQLHGDVVRAFGGDASVIGPYRRSVVEQNSRTGQPYPDGGMIVWRINTAEYKRDMRDRWASSQNEPGFWWTTHSKLEEIADYLQHITNEVEISKPTPKNPQNTIWQPSDHRMRWDWWDTEVYASAAADMVTGHDWGNLRALCEPMHHAPPEALIFDQQTEFSAR